MRQDTVSVARGRIIFVAEDIDNDWMESQSPHFEMIGINQNARFSELNDVVAGISIVKLATEDAYLLNATDSAKEADTADASSSWRTVDLSKPVREWSKSREPLTLVPWFARGNKGGRGHLRVPFHRVVLTM